MKTINDIVVQFNKQINNRYTQREKRQIVRMFLMERLQINEAELLLKKSEVIPENAALTLENDISRINNGEPIQYILGVTYFYGLKFKIDKRALIPRPETEELVGWILETIKEKNNKSEKLQIVDFGTGCACIPIALKKYLQNCCISGVDKIQDALNLAKENAYSLNSDVDFILADILELESLPKIKWDIIVSNPPYVLEKDKSEMEENVLKHEPHSALFVSDNDPLIFYRSIINYAKNQLKNGGFLFFEIHEKLSGEIVDLLKINGFKEIEIRKDLQGKDRMIRAYRY